MLPKSVQDPDGALVALEVERLGYTYADGRVALREVSFQARPGESLALIGPNGAGKTTLFLCLAGVLTDFAGSVQVHGLDPRRAEDRRRIPQVMAIVFQNSDDQLFHTTVIEEVAFGPLNLGCSETETRERVRQALEATGLVGFEERVPFHLSCGEKRRVALACALAMRPQVLLLDEPTTHLDPRGRRELIAVLERLTVTRIVASHDLEFVLQTTRRALVLDQGQLVADGPVAQILRDAQLMEAHGLEVPHSLTHPHAHVPLSQDSMHSSRAAPAVGAGHEKSAPA